MFIIVQTQFEGTHCYPEAPGEVAFLQFSHRHMFHVRAEIEVTHDDRELEIIMVKRNLTWTFADRDFGRSSCEEIAGMIQEHIKLEYPILDGVGDRNRIVNVEVLEDGENGAMVHDPIYSMPLFAVPTGGTITADQIVGSLSHPSFVQMPVYGEKIPTVAPKAVRMQDKVSYIGRLFEDVTKLDKLFGLDKDMELTSDNLMFLSNALAGEVGELCNFVKKIVRDGETEALWESLDFEIVDSFIYLVKIIKLIQCDFDASWDDKHQELRERYVAGKKHLSYAARPLNREQ